ADESSRGVLICGTGQAMTMTANRFQHVRAALCSNAGVARLAREHNDANVLVFGAGGIDVGEAETCLDVFLTTSFLEGRYAERRQRLSDLGGL
ncbi:MAG: RpiB/LacA/LacB family sugar-phosphate isomerase, partial [Alphaproteobacteria bacterium]|nr:RpiB/LacA/LacB family sugar-phosphate isomerase [Alphaproteobacteria bacterium]